MINRESARDLNLVGPVGRASGRCHDLRRECPYGAYEHYEFNVPREHEGDGYARLRVLFQEAYQSCNLIGQVIRSMDRGQFTSAASQPIQARRWDGSRRRLEPRSTGSSGRFRESGALSRDHSFLQQLDGLFTQPSKSFAFQDFPIILATFGLSATECDR